MPGKRPLLYRYYRRYLNDEDSAAYIKAVSQRYTSATLERLLEKGRRTTRRAAALALGFLGDYEVNAPLGAALLDRDRGVRMLAENAIRNVWTRAGSPGQRHQLTSVMRLIAADQFDQAAEEADELIQEAPWYAEAWNQRAIARFQLGRFAASIRDCHRTLELNPYHFAAAAGMGQCYLELNDLHRALESFRRALELNPGMEGVRAQVTYLERTLDT